MFGRVGTAEQVTAGIDLAGRTAVVTGVNSGLGQETLRVLSLLGAHVFGLARTLEKAERACDGAPGNASPFECELGDWRSVGNCAESIQEMADTIDILVANAGIMAPSKLALLHGLESQFAVNHMGHFVLAHRLLEAIRRSGRGRVVLVSSDAHKYFAPRRYGIDFDNLDGSRGYRPWQCYGRAKLANILHAKGLATRLSDSGGTANAVHPGIIKTGLGNDAGLSNTLAYFFSKPICVTVPQGAATTCFVAASPEVGGVNGQYFAKCRRVRHSRVAGNAQLAERLWSWSEEAASDFL